ncbi:efflux RND transporter periplasmic adaptor subunit [Microbacterium sp. NIBRBAC000506063]|uniref:efflux RND transporter periplasmic adaptor subunit n=1 Tax=Microbacterium sp. NIBRBAC000506063 TaxID=2734618 RepID=UPI001BB741DB|nr:efflux RND transporter periplasmic adaptor subunit [Microbacterium sp. NIBRBAC000506063]QTV80082.1 efflux RND transporter periplasmic adaptor subunit [Microbacterium sp. NIBRBAC000506063]
MKVKNLLGRLSRRAWIVVGSATVVVVAAAVGVFVFLLPSQAQAQPVTQTSTASLETMQKVVSASGTVTPAVKEDLSFAVSGVVTEIDVAAGDIVEEGTVLARVDTLALNASLLDAEATLAEAEATLAGARDANDGSSAAKARVSAASAAVDVAESAVADAEAALDDAALRAPATGLITSVGISVGDRVTGGSSGSGTSSATTGGMPGASTASTSTTGSGTAFSLVSTDAWTVSVTVGETDVAHVEAGLQVELATSDGKEFFGTVAEVGVVPSTSSGSARYSVAIDVTGTGEGLFDGVSVDVDIVYERRIDVLTVPSAAVTTTDGVSTVTLIEENGSEREVQVEIGETSGSLTEILSGLEEGDEVLVSVFTPGEGNTGGFPGGGQGRFPGGDFELPDGFEPPSGGFPGEPGGNG